MQLANGKELGCETLELILTTRDGDVTKVTMTSDTIAEILSGKRVTELVQKLGQLVYRYEDGVNEEWI